MFLNEHLTVADGERLLKHQEAKAADEGAIRELELIEEKKTAESDTTAKRAFIALECARVIDHKGDKKQKSRDNLWDEFIRCKKRIAGHENNLIGKTEKLHESQAKVDRGPVTEEEIKQKHKDELRTAEMSYTSDLNEVQKKRSRVEGLKIKGMDPDDREIVMLLIQAEV